jgi:protein O-mannosyl-transferase
MRYLLNREVCISVGLALVTGLSYIGILSSDFVNFDDDLYVYENQAVQMGLSRPSVNWAFTNTELANWHPLTWLSLEADYQLFGLHPAGFHATNLLLHIANTVALFWLLRKMTGAVGRSAWVAAFFALHPLHVESVAWISERKDVLSTFFLILSLLLWQLYARRSVFRYYALAVLLFVLSLMAKAMGVTLPLLLVLLDFWPLARWTDTATVGQPGDATPATISLTMEKLPFFLLGAFFAAIAILAQGRSGAMDYGNTLSLRARLLTAPLNYVTYLRQTFWPADLVVLYTHPGENLPWDKPLAAVLLLVLITAAAAWLRRSRPYLLFGWLWFLITLLPVIGLVQVGEQATADRYMYVPMIGLLIAVCWGSYDLAGNRRGLSAAVTLVWATLLCVCVELTARQVHYWQDNIKLWEHALAVAPPTTTACDNYAKALLELGRKEEAERWYHKALEIEPKTYAANFNLGVMMGAEGQHEKAAEFLEAALKSRPGDPRALENLGLANELQGRLDQAMEYYDLAIKSDPRSPIALRRLQHLKKLKTVPQ